jgi:NADP-dependent 3-hydroxy acid dehydrogenase YdfG
MSTGQNVSLTGKVAFVTGSSSGIGAAVARALAAAGVKLGLASRRLGELGLPDTLALACDIRDRGQVAAAVTATVRQFGGLDIVVANAGAGSYRPVVDTPAEEIDEMVDTNVKGLVYTAQATIPHLIARGGGDFVTLAGRLGGAACRTRRSMSRPNSPRSALRARSTTNFVGTASAAPTSVPVPLPPISAWGAACAPAICPHSRT